MSIDVRRGHGRTQSGDGADSYTEGRLLRGDG